VLGAVHTRWNGEAGDRDAGGNESKRKRCRSLSEMAAIDREKTKATAHGGIEYSSISLGKLTIFENSESLLDSYRLVIGRSSNITSQLFLDIVSLHVIQLFHVLRKVRNHEEPNESHDTVSNPSMMKIQRHP
jgi:hypothetical protein